LAEKKEYLTNNRNIRLSTDLATRISFPAQQETLEKGKKYYYKIRKDMKISFLSHTLGLLCSCISLL